MVVCENLLKQRLSKVSTKSTSKSQSAFGHGKCLQFSTWRPKQTFCIAPCYTQIYGLIKG